MNAQNPNEVLVRHWQQVAKDTERQRVELIGKLHDAEQKILYFRYLKPQFDEVVDRNRSLETMHRKCLEERESIVEQLRNCAATFETLKQEYTRLYEAYEGSVSENEGLAEKLSRIEQEAKEVERLQNLVDEQKRELESLANRTVQVSKATSAALKRDTGCRIL